ncbi:MAG: hypothetical protein K2O03_04440, partial [Lachnospiraceae bacterium]|nr:hypothetical protein [Lachnospiraceae bacterium]
MNRKLFNFGWEFCKKPLGISLAAVLKDNDFSPVELPHDWLIFNSHDLYETAEGWYRKRFFCIRETASGHPDKNGDTETVFIGGTECALLDFEGIYMNSTIYI